MNMDLNTVRVYYSLLYEYVVSYIIFVWDWEALCGEQRARCTTRPCSPSTCPTTRRRRSALCSALLHHLHALSSPSFHSSSRCAPSPSTTCGSRAASRCPPCCSHAATSIASAAMRTLIQCSICSMPPPGRRLHAAGMHARSPSRVSLSLSCLTSHPHPHPHLLRTVSWCTRIWGRRWLTRATRWTQWRRSSTSSALVTRWLAHRLLPRRAAPRRAALLLFNLYSYNASRIRQPHSSLGLSV